MKLKLTRFGSTPDGTFGKLEVVGETFYTVEQDWEDNEPGESCVPCGTYDLIWLATSTRVPPEYLGHTWYLEGETVTAGYSGKRRTRCAMHQANIIDHVRGCIGVGTGRGMFNGKWSVTSSEKAMKKLLDLIGPGSHELEIVAGKMG